MCNPALTHLKLAHLEPGWLDGWMDGWMDGWIDGFVECLWSLEWKMGVGGNMNI